MKNKYKNHKWSGPNNGIKSRDGCLVVECLRCGVIRQYVGGYPTYFIRDIVYDKIAPKCFTIQEKLKKS